MAKQMEIKKLLLIWIFLHYTVRGQHTSSTMVPSPTTPVTTAPTASRDSCIFAPISDINKYTKIKNHLSELYGMYKSTYAGYTIIGNNAFYATDEKVSYKEGLDTCSTAQGYMVELDRLALVGLLTHLKESHPHVKSFFQHTHEHGFEHVAYSSRKSIPTSVRAGELSNAPTSISPGKNLIFDVTTGKFKKTKESTSAYTVCMLRPSKVKTWKKVNFYYNHIVKAGIINKLKDGLATILQPGQHGRTCNMATARRASMLPLQIKDNKINPILIKSRQILQDYYYVSRYAANTENQRYTYENTNAQNGEGRQLYCMCPDYTKVRTMQKIKTIIKAISKIATAIQITEPEFNLTIDEDDLTFPWEKDEFMTFSLTDLCLSTGTVLLTVMAIYNFMKYRTSIELFRKCQVKANKQTRFGSSPLIRFFKPGSKPSADSVESLGPAANFE